MKQKSITVEVAVDGSIKIEGHGFTGPSCAKATAFLEKALGVETGSTKKPEYHGKEEQKAQVRQ